MDSWKAAYMALCGVAGMRRKCRIPLPGSFFVARRSRHTRLQGDWSSDVCSSDLQTINHQRNRRPRQTGDAVFFWRCFSIPAVVGADFRVGPLPRHPDLALTHDLVGLSLCLCRASAFSAASSHSVAQVLLPVLQRPRSSVRPQPSSDHTQQTTVTRSELANFFFPLRSREVVPAPWRDLSSIFPTPVLLHIISVADPGFRKPLIARSIPSDTFRQAASLLAHSVTALPYLGRACSFEKGAALQFTSLMIIGITQASILSCRARARFISMS